MKQHTHVLVLGSGPGGYPAAFRAADLGLKVTLVERHADLGGVCLHHGCIPSKTKLHAAKVIEEVNSLRQHGIEFGELKLDLEKFDDYQQNNIVGKNAKGLEFLDKKREIPFIQGTGTFLDANTIQIEGPDGERTQLTFDYAIIAAGSEPVALPFLPKDPRIMTSKEVLRLKAVPKSMLVLGGGIIGLEMAQVYHAFGSKITVVELGDRLIPGADPDIVNVLHKKIQSRYEILLNTKLTGVEAKSDGLWPVLEGKNAPKTAQSYDILLSAVGRTPNGKRIAAENAGIHVDAQGFIPVDTSMRTNVANIFAVGDIVGQPMLAHKATAQGRLAAEVIAGQPHTFDPRSIPSVAYTNPELAWTGLTETEAKDKGIPYKAASFPWSANARALIQDSSQGKTKLIIDPSTGRILGGAVAGSNAGELIAEIGLAIEFGATLEDLELNIHPHPTLSETVGLAAEMGTGTITDLLPPKE